MNSINESLRKSAIDKGLCYQWQKEWNSDKTTSELCRMMKRGMDFCVKHNYPDLNFIRYSFPLRELNENKVYIDQSVDVTDTNGTYVFLGNCQGELNLQPYSAALIHLRHNSKIKINCEYDGYVNIFLYEDSDVEIGKIHGSDVKIYDHRRK